MTDRWKHAVVVVVASLPLLAEVVRKYLYPSNIVLLAAEAVIILIAVVLTAQFLTRRVLSIVVAIFVLIEWKLISIAIGHQDPMLGLVGLRTFVIPCAYLLIGLSIYRAIGVERTAELIYKLFTIWLILIGVVMVLQLFAGREHWINALPEGFDDERAGIGDYTVGEFGLEYFFRPTSIFLHTGKLGAVLFVLATFRLFYAFATQRTIAKIVRGASLDLALLLVSGQRAAMIGYVLALALLYALRARYYSKRRCEHKKLVPTITATALIGSVVSLSWSIFPEISSLIWMRFVSGFIDVPHRVFDNLILPAGYVYEKYALAPAGVGAYSLGAQVFGGEPLYNIVPIGTAENSWLRLLAEEGLPGLLAGMIFWSALCLYAIRHAVRLHRGSNEMGLLVSHLSYGAAFALGYMLFWSNTHDIIGNTVPMSMVLLQFGVLNKRSVSYGRKERACYQNRSLLRTVRGA